MRIRIIAILAGLAVSAATAAVAANGDLIVNGNAGIGTTTPTQKLDVTGNINGSGNLTISGNVGVGKTNPGYKVDVNGAVNAAQVCIGGSCASNWRFGGFYMMNGATCVTKNPQTSACSCPSGFTVISWLQGAAGYAVYACEM